MLTRDQAIKAAFYSAANLYLFTVPNADSMRWMHDHSTADRFDLPNEVGAFVLDNAISDPAPEDVANWIIGMLGARIAPVKGFDARWWSFLTFATVLLAMRRLLKVQALTSTLPAGPPPLAAASYAEEDERIDARNPDPLERVDLGTSYATGVTEAVAARKSGKR